jgi:hypothetical protein
MYKQSFVTPISPLMYNASEQAITSHASEDKGKFRHPKITVKKTVGGPRIRGEHQ